jgi:hypothetical protein
MKLFVLADYLDTRIDLNFLFKEITNQGHEIIILNPKNDQVSYDSTYLVNIHPLKFLNRLYFLLYKIFLKIPSDLKKNYFIIEDFKIKNSNRGFLKKTMDLIVLKLSLIFGKFFTYDLFLNLLMVKYENITDIEKILIVSDVSNHEILSFFLKENKEIFNYIYSWDHHFKHFTFSKKIKKYFVWNDNIKSDLILYHKISSNSIISAGSTQLSFVPKFDNIKTKKIFDFIFIFSTGTDELISHEIELFKKLYMIFPDKKWSVRLYPFTKKNFYDKFNFPSSVKIFYPNKKNYLKNISDKFNQIMSSNYMIHIGTTLGLETAFINHKGVFLSFDKIKEIDNSIYNFMHQKQNDRYLRLDNKNVIKSLNEFKNILNIDLNEFMNYNNKIISNFIVKSNKQIAKTIINEI